MRFENLEPRIVFDQALGAVVEFEIENTAEPLPVETPVLPEDIQFRSTDEDFRYSSGTIDANTLDELVAATDSWADDPRPIYTFRLDDNDAWRKLINHNPISIHDDGYIVAERVATQADTHSLLVVQKPTSECHTLGGTYTKPNYHYRYSFDIRHPESELSWLTTVEGHWSVITEMWGPGSAGTGLNPPFSIHTSVKNGTPYWAISSRGDSRVVTERPYEEERFQFIPMENVGEWQRWDIEYVPNHEGAGIVRLWLNGEMVANWVDVKTSFLGYVGNNVVGPLNPSIGLYSYNPADGQEAHFDNITLQCSGVYESSISGRVTGTQDLAGNIVFATNQTTGERYGVETEMSGVYSLAIPRGEYTITAVNKDTGHQEFVENISTTGESSKVVDLDVSAPIAPPPQEVITTFTGDVTGDGVADVVNRFNDGTWQVTTVDADGNTNSAIWAHWSINLEWKDPMMADFNGDGMQDIAGRAENGVWWVGISDGTGFTDTAWGKWTPGIEWLHVSTGDFNGDGMDDIVGRAATNGSWWISQSDGDGFSNSNWGRWTTNVDWEVVVGDFTGDGLSDIAGRASSDGTWWIGASTGSWFQNSYWGKFTHSVPWSEFQVGDFNGDGRSDLVARAETDGTFWVAESTGDGFHNRYYGRWSMVTWADIQVADVDGDGFSDIVGRATSDNSWWVAKSTGEAFQNQYWGATWAQSVDWLVARADDFDGDGAADLLGGNANHWWLSR